MVPPLAYSSTVAFLAHYRVLTNAFAEGGLRNEEYDLFQKMNQVVASLPREERALLFTDPDDASSAPGQARRRERAHLRLRRLLESKGVVRG
jgi:hypothetical protein